MLAIVWTFPLVRQLSAVLPGASIGDNADFAWNFWWAREAWRSGTSLFHSDAVFAPFGIDLTLNTHTALAALVGATVFRSASPVAALNLVLLLSLFLNGFAAYLLAFEVTRNRGGSMLGGLLFAASPYVCGRLFGHFNLVMAAGLPLLVLCVLRIHNRSMWYAPAAGVVLGLIAYNDYYYLVYGSAICLFIAVWRARPRRFVVVRRPMRAGSQWALAILLALAVIGAGFILITGGFSGRVLGITVRAETPTNLLSFGWIVVAIWIGGRWRLRLASRSADASLTRELLAMTVVFAVALVFVSPLAWRGFALWSRGDYVSPPHVWKSAAGGVDLATLVLGNPFHPLFGSQVSAVYARLGINRAESVAWIGVVPALLLCIRRSEAAPTMTMWKALGSVFFVWALGPWLMIGGVNSGLMLPWNLVSFLPIVGNARIPGRAMVVVFLALSVLVADAIHRLAQKRRAVVVIGAAIALVVDYAPVRYPLVSTATSPIYARLAALPPGIVCPLPLGMRDGFSERGRFDDGTLLAQMVHTHPIAGGFVARLPPSVLDGYERTPVLRSILHLSGSGTVHGDDRRLSRIESTAALRMAGIRYLVLDRAQAPASLRDYVANQLELVQIDTDGVRDLFQLAP